MIAAELGWAEGIPRALSGKKKGRVEIIEDALFFAAGCWEK